MVPQGAGLVCTGRPTSSLTTREFFQSFRMDAARFKELADGVRPDIEAADMRLYERQACNGGGGPIDYRSRVAMFLLYVFGGSYIDIMQLHGVSETEFYEFVWTVSALNPPLPPHTNHNPT